MALDPGTTTGIAISDGVAWNREQYGPRAHHVGLFHLLGDTDPNVVVCESFTFQPRRTKIVLDSLEYIGVAKLWCKMNEVEFVLQTPTIGKSFWTDSKIKQAGLWRPNMPHAMDATRHLLFYWMQHVDNRFVERLRGD